MRKSLILCVILLILLTMCKKTPPAAVEIPEINNITTDEKVYDKVYIDNSKEITRKYVVLDINEKYVVLEESSFSEDDYFWYDDGFSVYEYNKNLKITEYYDSGNKLYSIGDGPYRYDGIYNDLLFIEETGDVQIGGLHIYDLAKKEEILDASYYRSYSFKNNIVSGLVMFDCSDYDDNIQKRFYEIAQDTKIPEEDYGLSTRFVVDYDFNVLTKEINLTYGTYIFEQ